MTITEALKRAREIESTAIKGPLVYFAGRIPQDVELMLHAQNTHKLLLDIADAGHALGCTCGLRSDDPRITSHSSQCQQHLDALQAFADYMGKAE